MRLSVAVMAHRTRTAYVEELLEALDAPAEVVWDTGKDVWDTRRRTLEAHDSSDFHVTIQDDAIVCRDLMAGVHEIVRHIDGPISLYTGTQRPSVTSTAVHLAIASYTNSPFFRAPGPHWGVGLVMPTALIPDLIAGAGGLQGVHADDMRMQRWFRAQKIDCTYTVPSLVDHRQGPSLVGHPQKGRRAHNFIGDASALDIDWGREPGPLPESGYVSFGMGNRTHFACCECKTWTSKESVMRTHLRRHHVRHHATVQ